jgi:hypothetical protein
MINATEYLREFITVFDASLDPDLWYKLVEEERNELHEALLKEDKAEILKEAADLCYVMTGFIGTANALMEYGLVSDDRSIKYKQVVEKADVKLSAAVAIFGWDTIEEAVRLVHESNMTKLGEDGKPVKREDGKILKGPNYKAPDLTALVAA